MDITPEQVRAHRLRAHHLDRRYPASRILEAAGACGLQNSPPGGWETALFQRLEGCSLPLLRDVLYRDRALLQAWSIRGVPLVFPAGESGVFLSPLLAREGECPWIYTRGITAALDFVGMSFDEAHARVREAARCLDGTTVRSKEALDQLLADRVGAQLPPEQRALWDSPSMYGRPDRQTVGGAAVSFLLRPCSFASLVVFGRREENSPTFTSFRRWLGREPSPCPQGEAELVRRFLHCYGPAAPADLQAWLGSSPQQAKRLWSAAAEEMEPVRVLGRTRWALIRDRDSLTAPPEQPGRLILLGPHDPYLDLRDRALVLEDPARQRQVWRTVSNPGAVLKDGRVAGIWTGKAVQGRLEFSLSLWEPLSPGARRALEREAGAYAAFRGLELSLLP
ncbi:winged helix DNA-binding domain-containing protein [Clostridium phoceensis]|uniref:winged helix DNA-binding domain-containing protein n=1 Tax=Clostridium phoceensis TaxID=1650661 RepID=UPI0023F8CE5D|nr:winged helix DNA-binding domain-containing protein [Clostridium phoceensis]